MATGFNRNPASPQFPPLPSSRAQSATTVVGGVIGPTTSYRRAVTAVPDNPNFANLERLPGKFVTVARSEPFSDQVTGRVLFGDTAYGMIGIVDQSNDQLCIFQTQSLDDLQILDQPRQPWSREENTALGLTSDVEAQKFREDRNLEMRREIAAKIGPEGTDPTVQILFDSLSKTLSCAWKGRDIVIHDVRIHPPYRAENCIGSNRVSLNRIQKIVAAEWKRIDESS